MKTSTGAADSTSASWRWVVGTNAGYFRSSRGRSAIACSPTQVERPGDAEHLVLGDAELGDQQLEHLRRDRLLDLEPHRRAEPAPQQLLLERLEEVLGVVLLDLEVLVAGDPEGVDLEHLHAREEALEVLADDVLERHEALVARAARTG